MDKIDTIEVKGKEYEIDSKKIGELTSLNTENKNNIVEAINEVNEKHLYRHDIELNLSLDDEYNAWVTLTIYNNNPNPIDRNNFKQMCYSESGYGINCTGGIDPQRSLAIEAIAMGITRGIELVDCNESTYVISIFSINDYITQIF